MGSADSYKRLFLQHSADNYTLHHIRLVVIHSLDTFNYKNGEFAAERLVALNPSRADSMYLYCLVLFRSGNYKSCYTSLVNSSFLQDWGCAYLFAASCLSIERFKEGIFSLTRFDFITRSLSQNEIFSTRCEFPRNMSSISTLLDMHAYELKRSIYPDFSAVCHVLGDLYCRANDNTTGSLYYSRALAFNQYDFEAFQKLCRLGVDTSIKGIFRAKKELLANKKVQENSNHAISSGGARVAVGESIELSEGVHNPFARVESNQESTLVTPRTKQVFAPDAPLRRSNPNTSNTGSFDFGRTSTIHEAHVSEKKPRRESTFSKITSRLILLPNTTEILGNGIRLLSKNVTEKTVDICHSPGHHYQCQLSSNQQKDPALGNYMNAAAKSDIEKCDRRLVNHYRIFARAYRQMCKYDCYKAIRLLESLPEHERDTCWVLSKLGRLHFEIVNYKQLERFFVKLRQKDRTRLEDMEFYLTLLWHLQRKVELTYLANEMHDLDSALPITWCVVGNLFSLNREADEAIKCFTKAHRLDTRFTYAYTLKGHEYFGTDNYEMALDNFRMALLLDPGHYNANYGIGMVYINLGDYQRANFYFCKAVAINPINIILICCVGMVMEKLGRRSLAMRQYELATKLQPLNPLPLFKKAQLLFSAQQFLQALECFLVLKDLAPDEASVHFLLGQLYNIKDDKFLAIREFTIALNLDPKGNYLVREAIELLNAK